MNFLRSFFILVLFQILVFHTHAQLINPVQVNSFVSPGASLYLSDYIAFNSTQWRVGLKFLDFNEGSREVSVKLIIKGSNISLATKNQISLNNKFSLFAGELIYLEGADLETYLRPDNLEINGSSREKITNGRLPEGLYEFCVEVYDVRTGELLSVSNCQSVWLQLTDVPIINFPINGTLISDQLPSIINFQWQQANIKSINATKTEYQLTVFEVLDPQILPLTALSNGQVQQVFQSDWQTNTSYVYGIADIPLRTGFRYISYVRVRDELGRDNYKNNGFSEIIWFYYGYPENGNIKLSKPANNYTFNQFDNQVFEWESPSNALKNELFDYKIVITELNDNQFTEQAILNNPIWHEETFINKNANATFSYKLSKTQKVLEKGKSYAWKVFATANGKVIAESKVNIVFGPPIIEEFYFGQELVKITSLTTSNLNELSGRGRFLYESGKYVEGSFENIRIEDLGGIFFARRGEIVADFPHPFVRELVADFQPNGKARFIATKARLSTTNGFTLFGKLNWDLPLITENLVQFKSKELWVNYADYDVTGQLESQNEQLITMLAPFGFAVNLTENSFVSVIDDKYFVHLDGFVTGPDNLKHAKDDPTSKFTFKNQNRIDYLTTGGYNKEADLRLFSGTNLFLEPKNWVADFTEEESYVGLEDAYMGIHIPTFDLRIENHKNKTNSFVFDQAQKITFDNVNGNIMVASIEPNGLQSKIKVDVRYQNIVAKFNTFPSFLNKVDITVVNSGVTDSKLLGEFQIPFFSSTDKFGYEIPIDYNGYAQGFLSEKFEDKIITFNKGAGDQEVTITLLRGVFDGNTKLEFECSLQWPGVNLEIPYFDNLTIWGNYNVGFGSINSSQQLQTPIEGDISGYKRSTKTIGVGRDKNLYALAVVSEVDYGEDVSGPDGVPVINYYSTYKSPLINENYSFSSLNLEEDKLMTIDYTYTNNTKDEPLEIDTENENAILDLAFAELEDEQEFNGTIEFDMVNGKKEYISNAATPHVYKVGLEDVVDIDNLIQVMDVLIALTKDETKKNKLISIKEKILVQNREVIEDVIDKLVESDFSINKLMKLLVDEVADKLSAEVTNKIDQATGKMVMFVDKQIDTVMARLFLELNPTFDQISATIVNKFEDPKRRATVQTIMDTTINGFKFSMREEMSSALKVAVYDNATGKIVAFIDKNLRDQIDFYITSKIQEIGYSLIDGKTDAIDVSALVEDGGKVLTQFSEALIEELKTTNGDKIGSTLESVGKDFVQGINWNNVAINMAKYILSKSAEAFVVEKVEGIVIEKATELFNNENTGALVGSVMQNVHLDFNNLGRNLKNGQIDKIVKFDLSYIEVKCKTAEFHGGLKLFKDDPEWGDCFKGNVEGFITKPVEIGMKAVYINGKVEDYKFWYVELAIPSGINVPLVPGIALDGIGGKVFKKMSYNLELKAFRPDRNNRYGAGLDLYCMDALGGKQMRLFVNAELTIMEDYYTMQLRGQLGAAFMKEPKGTDYSKGAAIFGEGKIAFSSKDNTLIGDFSVQANMKPIVCMQAYLDFYVSKDSFALNIGRKEQPNVTKVLCFIPIESYMQLNTQQFEMGIMMHINIDGSGPWINIGVAKVKPFIRFLFDLDAYVNIQVKPKLRIQEALLELYVYAGIGVDYKTFLKSGTWELAAAEFYGKVWYVTTDTQSTISGEIKGRVTVIGISVKAEMGINKNLKG